jgi:hypothetical protein
VIPGALEEGLSIEIDRENTLWFSYDLQTILEFFVDGDHV